MPDLPLDLYEQQDEEIRRVYSENRKLKQLLTEMVKTLENYFPNAPWVPDLLERARDSTREQHRLN